MKTALIALFLSTAFVFSPLTEAHAAPFRPLLQEHPQCVKDAFGTRADDQIRLYMLMMVGYFTCRYVEPRLEDLYTDLVNDPVYHAESIRAQDDLFSVYSRCPDDAMGDVEEDDERKKEEIIYDTYTTAIANNCTYAAWKMKDDYCPMMSVLFRDLTRDALKADYLRLVAAKYASTCKD